MFDVTGDAATTRGLKLTMWAMVFIMLMKLTQVAIGWLDLQSMPIVAGWHLVTWAQILILSPLMMIGGFVAAAGAWLCFRGTTYVWAKRFAMLAMAAFTVMSITRLVDWALLLLRINDFDIVSKGTGVLMFGMGFYLYYLLALDEGEDFPGGGGRGGRGFFVPLAPMLVGGVMFFTGEYYAFNAGAWVVAIAAGLTAFATYNRIPPDGPMFDTTVKPEMTPASEPEKVPPPVT